MATDVTGGEGGGRCVGDVGGGRSHSLAGTAVCN